LNGVHREIVHAPAIAGLMAKADAIVYDVSSFYSIEFNTGEHYAQTIHL